MRFSDLVAAYERIEATPRRTEMRQLLVDLIRAAGPRELPEILYLSQGLLRPEYEGVELGIADSLVRRAIVEATGCTEEEIRGLARETGDLGTTVQTVLLRPPIRASAGRTVHEVYSGFERIAQASGAGSQESKVAGLVDLLAAAGPVEAKYLARFALGQLRLGVRELTILDALTAAFGAGEKSARTAIEGSFNACSDLGVVAQVLAEEGVAGLGRIQISVGRPVRSMLAERATDLSEVLRRMEGRAALEYKYDGLRIQAHLPRDGAPRLFSRRLEDLSSQFPELVEELPRVIRRTPAIVEGECVAIDPGTGELEPFQEISRRRGRKYDLDRMQSEVPVRLFLFDLLMEGGEVTAGIDFAERRRRLANVVTETDRVVLATQEVVEDLPAATAFFDRAIADGCEGVMAKSLAPGSSYRAGARGFWWIKYKREYTHTIGDSIDGAVVGAFFGRGRRAGTYGALLVAVYNPKEDRFESFCKVGSGFDDALLAELPGRLRPYVADTAPPEVMTGLVPDVWMRPGLVLEIRGAELSLSPNHRAGFGKVRPGAGFALRFPRFTGQFRDDKGPTEATTDEELLTMYRSQVRQAEAPTGTAPAREPPAPLHPKA
ncbi:MAG: ATP-dependent DNA ligase [Thermoplasmata archaeon]